MSKPVFDAASNGASGNGSASWTHTVGSGSNRAIIVIASDLNGDTVTGATVGGNAMTQLQKVVISAFLTVYFFSGLAPSSGSNTITVSGSGGHTIEGVSASYSNVMQSGTFGTVASNSGSGSSTTNTVTTTSATNQLVIDSVGGIVTGPVSPTASQTQRAQATNFTSEADIAATGSNMTLTWSLVHTHATFSTRAR